MTSLSDPVVTKTVGEKAIAVRVAQQEYEDANMRYQAASRDRTEMVNRVNKAQREFDEAVAAMKKSAPMDTDWTRRPGVPV